MARSATPPFPPRCLESRFGMLARLLLALTLVSQLLPMAPAYAASVTSAAFGGDTGTVSVGGTLYEAGRRADARRGDDQRHQVRHCGDGSGHPCPPDVEHPQDELDVHDDRARG